MAVVNEIHFALLGAPGSVAQCLQNIVPFQIGVVIEDGFDRMTRTDLADDHADSDSHSANACPTVVGDAAFRLAPAALDKRRQLQATVALKMAATRPPLPLLPPSGAIKTRGQFATLTAGLSLRWRRGRAPQRPRSVKGGL